MRPRFLLALLLCQFTASMAFGQFKEGDPDGAKAGQASVQKWRAGIVVNAGGSPCKGIVGSAPLPIEWPEQDVKVIEEDVSPRGKMTTRMVEGTVKEMVLTIPTLQSGEEAHALITMEITRRTQIPPTDTDRYQAADAKKLDKAIRPYLAQSPLIESRNPKIVKLADDLRAKEKNAWKLVESIYDYVRETIKYENGPLKGAMAALRDGTGDCEEMTSLFIAICRAAEIPARTVWVPGHCYPEFYLVDEKGAGHWFPCQVAGARAFGGIQETRPILQKGDNFKPASGGRDRQRYRAEHLVGAGGNPSVRFVRDLLPN